MMKVFDLASGLPLFVDPLAVAAVLPSVSPPPKGVELANWIPMTNGSQLMVSGIGPLVVRGLPEAMADDVAKAKAAARTFVGITH